MSPRSSWPDLGAKSSARTAPMPPPMSRYVNLFEILSSPIVWGPFFCRLSGFLQVGTIAYISIRVLRWLTLAVVLVQLAVEGLAVDAERAGGVRFVAFSVVEGGFDGLAFDLFHR